MTDQADPDFLALSARQQTRIDRTFDRALPKLRSSGRKRRKLNSNSSKKSRSAAVVAAGGFVENEGDDNEGGGGFLPEAEGSDGGGFMLDDADDDDAGGGFMVDDEQEGNGGFMPDEPPALEPIAGPSKPSRSASTAASRPLRSGKIPFSAIPRLLASLNLPADEDVMNVFRASASGWTEEDQEQEQAGAGAGRRRGRAGAGGMGEEDEDLGVERKDFRAVCAAIMGDDEGEDGGMDVDVDEESEGGSEGSEGGDRTGEESEEDDSEEDTFEMGSNSSLSSLSDDSEYGASRKKTRKPAPGVTSSTRKTKDVKASTTRSTSTTPAKSAKRRKTTKIDEEQGPRKLVGRQREIVREIWDMLKRTSNISDSITTGGTGGRGRKGDKENNQYILGREEVKMWAREMGEMWTEDEITDMVTLFSTQHEGRGLSFDDLGQIMLRARVV